MGRSILFSAPPYSKQSVSFERILKWTNLDLVGSLPSNSIITKSEFMDLPEKPHHLGLIPLRIFTSALLIDSTKGVPFGF